MPEMMSRLPLDEIGGAKVFRPCTIAGIPRKPGDPVRADELAQVKPVNLRAMIDQRYIQVWRRNETTEAEREPGEVIVAPRLGTSNRFDVIVGRRVNGTVPLTRAEADALAKKTNAGLAPAETANA